MLKFEKGGSCGPVEMSIKEAFKMWWYRIESIFHIEFEIGLMGIKIIISILGSEFKFTLIPPYRPIYFPEKFNSMLSWVACTSLSKHKALEVQISPNCALSLGAYICNMIHMNHPGFAFELNLILLSISVHLYDGRHWDYETNTWFKEPEEIEEDEN
jgi:hypothetical protein